MHSVQPLKIISISPNIVSEFGENFQNMLWKNLNAALCMLMPISDGFVLNNVGQAILGQIIAV